MKSKIPSLLAIAALLCLAPPAIAETENGLEQSLEQLVSEIEELEAETAKRRAELAELEKQAAERHAELEQEFNEWADADPIVRWLQTPGGNPLLRTAARQPSSWVIGAVLAKEPGDKGLKVVRLLEDGAAEKAGAKSGDRIFAVNGIRVRRVEPLRAIINAAGEQEIKISLRRDGQELNLAMTPERNPELAKGIQLEQLNVPREQQWELRREAPRRFGQPLAQPPSVKLQEEIDELRELVEELAESIKQKEKDDPGEEEEQ